MIISVANIFGFHITTGYFCSEKNWLLNRIAVGVVHDG